MAGQPMKFKSPEQLEELYLGYLDYCEEKSRMPNQAGFISYLWIMHNIKICRDTFNNYCNDYPEFFDVTKSIQTSLEDSVLNDKNQVPIVKLAYLNNRHGYTSGKQEIEATNLNINNDISDLSDDDLTDRLAKLGIKLDNM